MNTKTVLVTCENCQTRFRVAKSDLNDYGRLVRCSKCDHEWLLETKNTDQRVTIDDDGKNEHHLDPLEQNKDTAHFTPGFRYLEHGLPPSSGNQAHALDKTPSADNPHSFQLYEEGHPTIIEPTSKPSPHDIFGTLTMRKNIDRQSGNSYIPAISLLLCFLVLFIVGMENIDKVEKLTPYIGSLYHRIGIHSHPKLTIQSVNLTSVFLASNDLLPSFSDGVAKLEERYSSLYKGLEINIRNDNDVPSIVDKIQIHFCNSSGKNCKIHTSTAGFLIPNHSNKHIMIKVRVPADATNLSIWVNQQKLVEGIDIKSISNP